jgi:DNA-binding HxlR family transcriptional regulator
MNKECIVYKTSKFIGKKWTLLILLELYKGKNGYKRFSELRKSLEKITPKVLSSRLKELEKHRLVKNKVDFSRVPIKSEYTLTKSGNEFIKIIKKLKKWSLKWKFKSKLCKETDCKVCEL